MICEPCSRVLDRMSEKAFNATSFGHSNCTAESLLKLGVFDEAAASRNCECFPDHPDKIEYTNTELPEEYLSRLSKLREEEKGVIESRQELQKRRERENEEEVVKEK